MRTISLTECNATYLEFNKKANIRALRSGISETQYCAYDPNGVKDSCAGDGGGPLQMVTGDTATTKIVGIVSFGVSCGSRLPGIYTRVGSYLDWIESIVWPSE